MDCRRIGELAKQLLSPMAMKPISLRRSPGYFLANLHTSYKVTDKITIFGLVNNLFDTRYYTYGTFGPVSAVPWPSCAGRRHKYRHGGARKAVLGLRRDHDHILSVRLIGRRESRRSPSTRTAGIPPIWLSGASKLDASCVSAVSRPRPEGNPRESQDNSKEKPRDHDGIQIHGACAPPRRRSAWQTPPPASARQSVSVTFMRCGGSSGSRPRRRAVASATR